MLTRREMLKNTGTAAALLATGWLGRLASAAESRPSERLNFLFILTDDLGRQDVGCYGSKFYETPNVDRLAKQGMLFTDAYAACPVCSPTRASILTGKYPARLHITDFIAGRLFPHEKLAIPEWTQHLPLEEVTVAEALKAAGYTTGIIGKWHLGGAEFAPEKNGFDVNVGGMQIGSPRSYFSPYGNKKLPDGPKGEYLTDRLAAEAGGFIEKNKDNPFMLYLSFYTVHTPIQPRPDLKEKYDKKLQSIGGGKYNTGYAAMVEAMDQAVGNVLGSLDKNGLADRTVVVFYSDNGGLVNDEGRFVTSNEPLREGKGFLYEGGVREPLIVRWPGVVKSGSRCSEVVTSVDFYPTLLELAATRGDPKHNANLDGMSIVPLLKDPAATLGREAVYWHYPHYNYQGAKPGGAIRCGNYKLIEYFDDNRVELYDLREDLSEKNDLAAKMPEKAAELKLKLVNWRNSVGAQMPTPNPDYDPQDPTRESKWGRQVP